MKYLVQAVLHMFLHIAYSQDLEMLILHNNDMHARFEETKESRGGKLVGGFARTSHIVKEARQMAESGKGPPVLYLNAGDTYTGTIWFSVHKWKIATEFLNALKPDVACLGNHEFDGGISGLNPFVQEVNFPIVSANIDFRNESILAQYIKPYTVLNVNGRKIGVIGYLTPSTAIMATIGNIVFEDEITALKRECKNLEKEGVNIIIALGHSGYKMDMAIAKEVKCIDLVIGGHTNTFLWNGPQPDNEVPVDEYPTVVRQKNGKVVPVVQAYAYTKYMGKLNVVFDNEGILKTFNGQPIFLNEAIPQDPEILKLLENFRPAVYNYNHQVIGKSRTFLNGNCRIGECNFGNALIDSFVDYIAYMYKGPYWTSTPIGIVNGGTVRISINSTDRDRNITAGDILGAIPFNQQLVTFDLTGEDLLRTLELGVRSDGETSKGEFLQVSGLKVIYDFTKPRGERVVSVKARCGNCHIPVYSPLKLNERYRVVSTNFLTNGGDGHTVLRDKSTNLVTEEFSDAHAMQRYFEFYKVLTPQEEERIIIYSGDDDKSSGVLIKCNFIFVFNVIIFYFIV